MCVLAAWHQVYCVLRGQLGNDCRTRERTESWHMHAPHHFLMQSLRSKAILNTHVFLAAELTTKAYCQRWQLQAYDKNTHLLLTSSISSSSSPISSNWISSSSPGPNVSVSLILAMKEFREVKECTHTVPRQTEYSCPTWTSNLKWKDSYHVLEAPHTLSGFWLHLHCILE